MADDDPVELDEHRGMAAQRAAEIRRRRFVRQEAEGASLRDRHQEIDRILTSPPAADWLEAASNARVLIRLLAYGSLGQDRHYQALIARVLLELDNLSRTVPPCK